MPSPRSTIFLADRVTWVRACLWLAVLALVGAPLAAVVSIGLGGNHIQELLDGGIASATTNSVVSAGVSAAAAVVIATIMALVLDRTDLPGRSVLRLILLSPLLIPPFVGAIAWTGLLGPSGMINSYWNDAFGGGPLWNIYGGDGVIFLLTVHSYPLAYLIISAALRRVPGDLEQAARIGGASPWRAMRDVTLPLLRPALLASLTLTAVSIWPISASRRWSDCPSATSPCRRWCTDTSSRAPWIDHWRWSPPSASGSSHWPWLRSHSTAFWGVAPFSSTVRSRPRSYFLWAAAEFQRASLRGSSASF